MKLLIDLHLHSRRSYDNRGGPSVRQILDRANQLGLQGLAITDHNRLLPVDQFTSLAGAYDLTLLAGIEITCSDGHLIVLGLDEEPPEFRSVFNANTYLEKKSGFVIAAHPFDPKYGLNETVFELDLDAIEINGRRNQEINSKARTVASDLGLPLVGSSDAHRLEDMGNNLTLVEVENESSDAILQALSKGKFKVVGGV